VIAVPALELAAKVVEVGNCSGRDVEKFERFGLTPVPAERVAVPLVAECFANLECKVADMVVPLCQLNGRRVLGGGPGVCSKHHGIRSSRWTERHRLARNSRYSGLISAHSSAHNGRPHWKVNMHGMPVPTWFE
jgi:hypothetical protein